MDKESVGYGQMVGVIWMTGSLWGHPKHQGGEEYSHDTKEERELLPGPNNLRRIPCRGEFRQPLLNLHRARKDAVTRHVNQETVLDAR